jgi:hypothetical protein
VPNEPSPHTVPSEAQSAKHQRHDCHTARAPKMPRCRYTNSRPEGRITRRTDMQPSEHNPCTQTASPKCHVSQYAPSTPRARNQTARIRHPKCAKRPALTGYRYFAWPPKCRMGRMVLPTRYGCTTVMRVCIAVIPRAARCSFFVRLNCRKPPNSAQGGCQPATVG